MNSNDRATLISLFSRVAQAHPDSTAVVSKGRRTTYHELDQRSDALASKIVACTPAQQLVPILLPRGPEQITGMLAILKASCAYVPCDLAWPEQRRAFVLADTKASTFLALGDDGRAQCLLVPRQGNVTPAQSLDVAPRDLEPGSVNDLAYVLYTSGSTGEPKGVPISHANVISLFDAVAALPFAFDSFDTWLMSHAFTLNFSVWEIWGALLHGACVVIASEAEIRDPWRLTNLICETGVTVLSQTPSTFANAQAPLLKRAGDLALRYVVFGGETLLVSDLLPWAEHFESAGPIIVNMYGITEVTVHATFGVVTNDDIRTHGASNIGRALPGTVIELRDDDGELVLGEGTGEAYITGPGVARGYLNRSELTQSRFRQWPGRLHPTYRSGDLLTRLPDETFCYEGRSDDQVKVRGYRIEPGEVVRALTGHGAVSRAVVSAIQTGQADTALVAYYVLAPDAPVPPSPGDLQRFLASLLPEYMVPAAYVSLQGFPLTSNGKVALGDLPRPVRRDFDTTDDLPATPLTPTEQILSLMWARLLHQPLVKAHDDFFALGGDSLLAVRCLAEVRQLLQIDLELSSLFDAPLLHEFAVCVDAASSRPLIQLPDGRAGAREPQASLAQEHRLVLERRLIHNGGRGGDLIPVAVRADTILSAQALRKALTLVVNRHQPLRTAFMTLEGTGLAIVDELDEVNIDVTSTALSPAIEGSLVSDLVADSCDITCWPLFKSALFVDPEAKRSLFVFAADHSVFDGVSTSLFLAELLAEYRAALSGETLEDKAIPLKLSFAEFSHQQRRWCDGAYGQAALRRIAARASQDEPVWRLSLPERSPGSGNDTGATSTVTRALEASVAQAVRQTCRRLSVSPFMFGLGCLLVALRDATGDADISVITPSAGRSWPGTDQMIGFFSNLVTVRVNVADLPPEDVLAAARLATLEALRDDMMPFAEVKRLLYPHLYGSRITFPYVFFDVRRSTAEQVPDQDAGLVRLETLTFMTSRREPGINVLIDHDDDGLLCSLVYVTSAYAPDTIDGLLDQFVHHLIKLSTQS